MKTTRLARTNARYLTTLAGFIALSLALIVALNLLVDPLWYFSGTRIGTRNYELNLRVSKINLIRDDPDAYDCMIFGASVTTLLNASKFPGHKCFNAAFNGATAEELAVYARYFREIGVDPRLVIVGLDPADLTSARPSNIQMPEFIKSGESPPPVLRAYSSASVAWFSIQSTLDMGRPATWYTRDFVCRLMPREPMTPAGMLDQSYSYDDFSQESRAVYADLLDTWPQARTIGYVPYVNAWVVAHWREEGVLGTYLETVHAFSGLFDEFYDFSAPSHITTDLMETNDGEHYSESANDLIAARLSGDRSSLGISVHGRSYEEFETLYLGRVEELPTDIVNFVNTQAL
ncbi:MAG: hypothetical protein ACREDZ_06450 [Kiloniellales bacterium]